MPFACLEAASVQTSMCCFCALVWPILVTRALSWEAEIELVFGLLRKWEEDSKPP